MFVTPQTETFTVLCPKGPTTLKLQKEGKLTLEPGCKGYSSYVTLYALSTFYTNLTNDYVPSAPIDFDCCFEDLEKLNFEELPLQIPLVNVMSNIDDLRVASMRADEVQQMIKDQETKHERNLYMMATSWGSTLGVIFVTILCICLSCCCCKCCRNSFFWLWGKWHPKECWKQTQEKCCVSVYNYNGSRVEYAKTNTSPAVSIKSLPGLESPSTSQPKKETEEKLRLKDDLDSIAKRTRSKSIFR